jgi:probable HAF family extracellular repeat protein
MKTTSKTFSGLLSLGFVLFVFSASTPAQTTTCSSTGVPIIVLGALGGGGGGGVRGSGANAINNRGQVAGGSSTAAEEIHAFLWQKGEMEDLGTLGGDSYAFAINDRGQVVGQSSDSEAISEAVLWDTRSKDCVGR